MRDYVCAILEAAGEFVVHEATNGFEALRTLPRETFGLIITDINMPDVSGIELTRFVRQSERHRDTPLIVISTDAAKVDQERALAAGATAYLPKPFGAEALLALVEATLKEREAAQAAGSRPPTGPQPAAGSGPSPGANPGDAHRAGGDP